MTTHRTARYVGRAILTGALFVVPVYLAGFLLTKIGGTLATVVQPLVGLFPRWFPGERVLSLLLVITILFLVGAVALTPRGRSGCEKLEKSVFRRIPGYALFRSLTQRVAEQGDDNAWKPALVEIEDALVPAFIIEALDGDRFTVFVPSAPTPLAGTIYVLSGPRVHPLNVPFTQAVRTISQWGTGSGELVAAMRRAGEPR